jgi:hypothetical protein
MNDHSLVGIKIDIGVKREGGSYGIRKRRIALADRRSAADHHPARTVLAPLIASSAFWLPPTELNAAEGYLPSGREPGSVPGFRSSGDICGQSSVRLETLSLETIVMEKIVLMCALIGVIIVSSLRGQPALAVGRRVVRPRSKD